METLELTKQKISHWAVPGLEKDVSLDLIQIAVCAEFDIDFDLLIRHDRHREIVRPRQIAMAIAANYTDKSLYAIGCYFGYFGHATVIHAKKAFKNDYDTDPRYRERVHRIKRTLGINK